VFGTSRKPTRIFELAEAAQKSWRLRGYNQLPKVIQGVKFTHGMEVVRLQAQTAARLTPSVTKIRR
jgi:hypothetical protein